MSLQPGGITHRDIAETAKALGFGRKDGLPKPPAAKRDLPRPFKAGDRVLDRRDITSSIDVMDDPKGGRISRGVTMREDRDSFMSPKSYQAMTTRMINKPPDTSKLPTSRRRVSRRRVQGRR